MLKSIKQTDGGCNSQLIGRKLNRAHQFIYICSQRTMQKRRFDSWGQLRDLIYGVEISGGRSDLTPILIPTTWDKQNADYIKE